jgi:hypothetical protein
MRTITAGHPVLFGVLSALWLVFAVLAITFVILPTGSSWLGPVFQVASAAVIFVWLVARATLAPRVGGRARRR